MGLYMREVARGVAKGRLAACATREMCANIMKTPGKEGEAGCRLYFYLFIYFHQVRFIFIQFILIQLG